MNFEHVDSGQYPASECLFQFHSYKTGPKNRMFSRLEKQSSVGAFQKSYSEKFCKIPKKIKNIRRSLFLMKNDVNYLANYKTNHSKHLKVH